MRLASKKRRSGSDPYDLHKFDRPVRWALILDELRREPSVEVIRRLLAAYWTDWEYVCGGRPTILRAFRQARFVTDDHRAKRPRRAITVYRGCSPNGRRGFCWTTSREKAAWFANRARMFDFSDATVYRALVAPKFVLGKFFGRHEFEVIVDPAGLKPDHDRPDRMKPSPP